MSAVTREYEVEIRDHEGTLLATLDLQDIESIPPVTYATVTKVGSGRSMLRPFTVPCIDRAGTFTTLISAGGRFRALGLRFVILYRDWTGDEEGEEEPDWVELGGGVVSDAREGDGPGLYQVEVSSEAWVAMASDAGLFGAADTTQFWPEGRRYPWRGLPAAFTAAGSRIAASGNLYRIRIVAGGAGKTLGRAITEALVRWVEGDQVDDPKWGEAVAGGNFEHLRLHYAGTDYPVVTFSDPTLQGDLLTSLRDPEVFSADSESGTVTVHAWIYSASEPPSSGAAYLWAPGAEPSRDLPLHLGVDHGSHDWGVSGGWMHPATIARRVWDQLGVQYDDDAVTALEADASFPSLAPVVFGPVANAEAWLASEILGPLDIMALQDFRGRRLLVDMRLPQDVDPDELTVLDASNARNHRWSLEGSELYNAIQYRYLKTVPRAGAGAEYSVYIEGLGVTRPGTGRAQFALDGVAYEEEDYPEVLGDTIARVGRRVLTRNLFGALEPVAALNRKVGLVWDGRGALFAGAVAAASRDALDVYQDGAWRGSVDPLGSVAKTLQEGDLVVLDVGSFKGPNPASGDRTGLRIVRIITLTRHPAHGEIEYLDLGPRLAPLATPTVTLAQAADGSITATVSDLPSGAKGTVEVGFSSSSTPPEQWPVRGAGLANSEAVTVQDPPGTGWVHARIRATAPGRTRSAWGADSLELASVPRVRNLRVEYDEDGVPWVFGEPNSVAAGVRMRIDVHAVEDDADPGDPEDYAAGDLTTGIELDDVTVPPGSWLTAEVEPFPTFSGGEASGTAGPRARASRRRARGVDDPPPTGTGQVTLTGLELLDALGPEESNPTGAFLRLKLSLMLGDDVRSVGITVEDINAGVPIYWFAVEGPDSVSHVVQDGSENTATGNDFVIPRADMPGVVSITAYSTTNGTGDPIGQVSRDFDAAGLTPVVSGGTGRDTLTAGGIVTGAGTDPVHFLLPTVPGRVLAVEEIDEVLTWVEKAITLDELTGTLPQEKGGTNQDSYVAGDLLYANGDANLARLSIGTNGHVLTLVGGLPAWAAGGADSRIPNSPSTAGAWLTPNTGNSNWQVAGWQLPTTVAPSGWVIVGPPTGTVMTHGQLQDIDGVLASGQLPTITAAMTNFANQNVLTSSSPTFAGLTISNAITAAGLTVNGQARSPCHVAGNVGAGPFEINWNSGNVQSAVLNNSGTPAITVSGGGSNAGVGGCYTLYLRASGGTRTFSISATNPVWLSPEPDYSLSSTHVLVITVLMIDDASTTRTALFASEPRAVTV
jgi:hypothetical protein